MKIKYVFPQDIGGLGSLIDKAARSASTTQKNIQVACVAILHHAYNHGDYSHAELLVERLGNGVRADSLVQWFVKFGGLEVSKDGFTGWSGKQYIKDNFEDAKENMWSDVKKAADPYQAYDINDVILRVANQISKKQESIRKRIVKYTNAGMLEEAEKIREANIVDVQDETIDVLMSAINFDVIEQDVG